MKQAILFLLALLWLVPGQAQSKKEIKASLSRDLESYRRHSLSLNFDSVFQFTPPAMFDIIPKDSLLSIMRHAMSNEYLSLEMTGFEYKEIPKPKKAGKFFWTLVEYDGSMNMHIKGENMSSLLLPLMKAQFGSDNVKDAGNNTLAIAMKKKKMIAFKDPAYNNWMFVEDKRNDKGKDAATQKMILEAIVPEEVRTALDKVK